MYNEGMYSDSVMVGLLPMDAPWSTLTKPHLTLVYAGSVGEHDPMAYNEMGKDAMDLGISFGPQTLETLGVQTMGEGPTLCDAVVFKPTPDLLAMHDYLKRWDASEWPFKPHVTIGPVGTPADDIPAKVTFDKVYTQWGSQCFTTQFKP